MESQLKSCINRQSKGTLDVRNLCDGMKSGGVYQGNIICQFDAILNDVVCKSVEQTTLSPVLIEYKTLSIRKDLSIFIRINPSLKEIKTVEPIYFSVGVSKYFKPFLLVYLCLVLILNSTTGLIIHIMLNRERMLAGVELSKDKTSLQFDNLMFYIENLNHEVNSPLFILSRKLKELRNKTEGNEKNFEIIFNSIEQISAVMQRTKDVKKINRDSSDRTIFDLIESTILTIGVMRSETITCHTDSKLDKFVLNQKFISNGTFINILTNHIKNSIEAYADTISSKFINEQQDQITFTFTDDGNGIVEENRDKIFEKGFSTKGDNMIRGSGLSINKFIIESAGGFIKLNETEHGAQFEITVPIKPVEE